MKLPSTKTKKSTSFVTRNALVYGVPKVGKTTAASKIAGGKGVLFIPTENGYENLEIYQPFGKKKIMTKWTDIYEVAELLYKEKKHPFKYIAIDTVDFFVKHCEAYISEKHNVEHVSDLAFGKGSSFVKDELVKMVNGFNSMGLGVMFISHAKEREMKTKNASWTYMDSSLSPSIGNLLSGLCDFIFYCYTDDEGNRKIRTKRYKYVNAGDRSGLLPEIMDLDFVAVQKQLEEGEKK